MEGIAERIVHTILSNFPPELGMKKGTLVVVVVGLLAVTLTPSMDRTRLLLLVVCQRASNCSKIIARVESMASINTYVPPLGLEGVGEPFVWNIHTYIKFPSIREVNFK